MKADRRYAGITDKNGREVFEGDILKASVWSNAELVSFDAVVEYDGEFRLKALDESVTYKFCSICKSRSEIVGNVYDDPELFEVGERE
jgi:uncharacterized phage protein (TIGR01671 family)